MSATEYDRWYLVPAVTRTQTTADGTTTERLIPKYSDRDGIRGFSGNTIDPGVVTDSYPALTQTYPDVSEWYIVRLYGSWAALNGISVLGDSRNLATNPQDVAAVLNQRFPGLERTGEEWAGAFLVGPAGDLSSA